MRATPDPATVLIVDDEPDVLDGLAAQVGWEGYVVTACASPAEALERMSETNFAVIISDQLMPGMTGLEFFGRARQLQPNASRVLITGVLALDTVVSAINEGEIFRFLAKPWSRAELVATLENATQRHRLLVDNVRLGSETLVLNRQLAAANSELLTKVEQLTEQKAQLDAAHTALNENFEHSLGLCYRIINTFYPLLGARTKAVVELCRKMTQSDDFTAEEKHVLVTSAWLHDIGLIGVNREVLHKFVVRPEDCVEADWVLIRQHPVYGQTLAGFVDRLNAVGATIRAHHERFDGHGYPDGLAGQAIPWTARCLAVASAFVERGLQHEQVSDLVVKQSGTAFDPDAVRLFFQTSRVSELPRNVRELKLSELRSGMQLAKGIFSPAGLLLFPEGQALSDATIAKIKNHNLLNHVTQRLLVYG